MKLCNEDSHCLICIGKSGLTHSFVNIFFQFDWTGRFDDIKRILGKNQNHYVGKSLEFLHDAQEKYNQAQKMYNTYQSFSDFEDLLMQLEKFAQMQQLPGEISSLQDQVETHLPTRVQEAKKALDLVQKNHQTYLTRINELQGDGLKNELISFIIQRVVKPDGEYQVAGEKATAVVSSIDEDQVVVISEQVKSYLTDFLRQQIADWNTITNAEIQYASLETKLQELHRPMSKEALKKLQEECVQKLQDDLSQPHEVRKVLNEFLSQHKDLVGDSLETQVQSWLHHSTAAVLSGNKKVKDIEKQIQELRHKVATKKNQQEDIAGVVAVSVVKLVAKHLVRETLGEIPQWLQKVAKCINEKPEDMITDLVGMNPEEMITKFKTHLEDVDGLQTSATNCNNMVSSDEFQDQALAYVKSKATELVVHYRRKGEEYVQGKLMEVFEKVSGLGENDFQKIQDAMNTVSDARKKILQIVSVLKLLGQQMALLDEMQQILAHVQLHVSEANGHVAAPTLFFQQERSALSIDIHTIASGTFRKAVLEPVLKDLPTAFGPCAYAADSIRAIIEDIETKSTQSVLELRSKAALQTGDDSPSMDFTAERIREVTNLLKQTNDQLFDVLSEPQSATIDENALNTNLANFIKNLDIPSEFKVVREVFDVVFKDPEAVAQPTVDTVRSSDQVKSLKDIMTRFENHKQDLQNVYHRATKLAALYGKYRDLSGQLQYEDVDMKQAWDAIVKQATHYLSSSDSGVAQKIDKYVFSFLVKLLINFKFVMCRNIAGALPKYLHQTDIAHKHVNNDKGHSFFRICCNGQRLFQFPASDWFRCRCF